MYAPCVLSGLCMKLKSLYIAVLFAFLMSCGPGKKISNGGTPWQHSIQQIPGRIEFEYYNEGGEGVAYHDSDSLNNGSGKLNPAGPLKINSTHDSRDTVAWRQWHHWNRSDSIGSIILKKGIHLLTLHIVTNGNMNLDYMDLGTYLKTR